MIDTVWEHALVQPGMEDSLWELFHENSKITKYQKSHSDADVLRRMAQLHESLPFDGYPITPLPEPFSPLPLSIDASLTRRASTLNLIPVSLSLDKLAALLFYAYGVTRNNEGTSSPRSFRTVPSAGALYPLELFFHTAHVEGIKPGLYHFNPIHHHIRLLREGEETDKLSQALVQTTVAQGASVQIFLTALFERSTFKYGERGYRFVFLEAGHVAQNLNLVATALGLGCLNVGGFFDRAIDDFLGLDGLTHSTIYMTLLGKRSK